MANIRVRLVIEGRVQGVFFRDATRREATRLGVFGWVRNIPGGNVEVLAEGPEEKVQELVEWCHQGPPASQVTRLHKTPEEWQGEFESFRVTF